LLFSSSTAITARSCPDGKLRLGKRRVMEVEGFKCHNENCNLKQHKVISFRETSPGRIVKNVSEKIRRCRYIIMLFYTAAN
jgi:hypothetical protein